MEKEQHLTAEEIALYAEALNENRVEKISKVLRMHVAECDDCTSEVLQVAELIRQEQNLSNNQNYKIVFYRRLAVAASILLIVGTAYFLGKRHHVFVTSNRPVAEEMEQESLMDKRPVKKEVSTKQIVNDSADYTEESLNRKTEIKEKKIKFAENFVPDKNLEELALRFEKAAFRGEDIEVITSHEIEVNQQETITLRWENPNKELLYIEVFNNKGQRIIELETTTNSYTLPEKSTPGIYYWKLINEDFDLLYCGKIRIKEN